jgi:hypothetical protein
MDKNLLVEKDVEEGERLLRALDSVNFPVIAAFWYYLPEGGPWRLQFASPVVDQDGPRAAYRKIQEVMAESGPYHFGLDTVAAVSPSDPLVMELRIFAGTDGSPFIGGFHLHKTPIGDMYIEGAYIYRAERVIGQSGVFSFLCATPQPNHKTWKAWKCKITIEGGIFKKVEVEGYNWPQTQTRQGVNIHLGIITNSIGKGKNLVGDIMKWTILGGRLRSVETIAQGVTIEVPEDVADPSATSAPPGG